MENKNYKYKKLKKLNNKVNNISAITGYIIGLLGSGIFCFGITIILNLLLEKYEILGISLIIIGLILIIINYSIFNKIHNYLKNKFKDEILELSNELLK